MLGLKRKARDAAWGSRAMEHDGNVRVARPNDRAATISFTKKKPSLSKTTALFCCRNSQSTMPLPVLALLAHDLPAVCLHIVCDFAFHITGHEAMQQLGINTQLDRMERILRDQNDVDQKLALDNFEDAIESALAHGNDSSAEDYAHLASTAAGRVGNYDSRQHEAAAQTLHKLRLQYATPIESIRQKLTKASTHAENALAREVTALGARARCLQIYVICSLLLDKGTTAKISIVRKFNRFNTRSDVGALLLNLRYFGSHRGSELCKQARDIYQLHKLIKEDLNVIFQDCRFELVMTKLTREFPNWGKDFEIDPLTTKVNVIKIGTRVANTIQAIAFAPIGVVIQALTFATCGPMIPLVLAIYRLVHGPIKRADFKRFAKFLLWESTEMLITQIWICGGELVALRDLIEKQIFLE